MQPSSSTMVLVARLHCIRKTNVCVENRVPLCERLQVFSLCLFVHLLLRVFVCVCVRPRVCSVGAAMSMDCACVLRLYEHA